MTERDMSNRALLERIEALEARVLALETLPVEQPKQVKQNKPAPDDGIPTK